jgi:hypothetical protein
MESQFEVQELGIFDEDVKLCYIAVPSEPEDIDSLRWGLKKLLQKTIPELLEIFRYIYKKSESVSNSEKIIIDNFFNIMNEKILSKGILDSDNLDNEIINLTSGEKGKTVIYHLIELMKIGSDYYMEQNGLDEP